MSYRGRLAPTPSGYLHLGHAQTFWKAFQRCQQQHGHLVLRQEDLDGARCKPEFAQAAEEDLAWLGIHWHEGPYWQSQRMPLYQQHFERLILSGHIYPCSCSRKEILQSQRAPHQGDEEPLYSGLCRQKMAGSPVRSWRFRVPDGATIEFQDQAQGPQAYTANQDFGDFVVWRPDHGPSYQLACVVDDALMQISEVVRGADLLLSTARQILLYQALGYPIPQFYHCPLVTDAEGVRLAKRHDALSLRALRLAGKTPQDILNQFSER